jgi:hypothetical protein
MLRGKRALRLRQVIKNGAEIEGGDPLFDLRPVWMAEPSTVAELFPRTPCRQFAEPGDAVKIEALPTGVRSAIEVRSAAQGGVKSVEHCVEESIAGFGHRATSVQGAGTISRGSAYGGPFERGTRSAECGTTENSAQLGEISVRAWAIVR